MIVSTGGERVILPVTTKLQIDLAFARYAPGPIPTTGVVTVTRSDVERWTQIHGDQAEWVHASDRTHSAPPSILYYPSQNLLNFAPVPEGYQRQPNSAGGGGLARYGAEFLDALPIDRQLTVRGSITGKYVRRGRGYIDWTTEFFDGNSLIQRQTKSWVFSVTPEEAEAWPDRAAGKSSNEDGEGAPFGTLDVGLSREQFDAFEGPEHPNDTTHTNLDLARKAGFPNVRAQGGIPFGLLVRLMTHHFGERFLRGGTLEIRLLNPAFAGELLTLHGAVTGQTATHTLCRIRATRPDGAVVAAGTASARTEH